MTVRIVADTLIPGRGEPIEAGTVILDRQQISYAGPSAEAPATSDTDDIVEVPVVLPGL
jgi:hypothetical protein